MAVFPFLLLLLYAVHTGGSLEAATGSRASARIGVCLLCRSTALKLRGGGAAMAGVREGM